MELQLWTPWSRLGGKRGRHGEEGWWTMWQRECHGGKNKQQCKEGSKLEGGEFRSWWAARVYICISVGPLAIKQGHGESQRKRSPSVWLLLVGSSTEMLPRTVGGIRVERKVAMQLPKSPWRGKEGRSEANKGNEKWWRVAWMDSHLQKKKAFISMQIKG